MWPTTVPWLAPTSWWMSSGALTRRKASAKAGWRAESCLTRLVTNQAGVMSAPSWPRVMQKQPADHARPHPLQGGRVAAASAGAGPAPASQAASTDLPAPGSPVSRNSRSEPVSSHSATCRRAHTRPTSPAARWPMTAGMRTRLGPSAAGPGCSLVPHPLSPRRVALGS